jgi:two-component system cell cycle sensor histidine kinase/response regulator CckA
MTETDPAYLVDGKYAIGDLVDLTELRDIFEKFTRATGFTIGFLDHPGLNILVATGWRDICTKFHRGCPASADICGKSNQHLLGSLTQPNQLIIEPCEHGLVDCATPIVIKGKHIASLATGQLLLGKPNLDRFRAQARLYGYDEKAYLDALAEIPVVSEEQLRRVTAFLGSLAVVVTELGYANLKIREESVLLEKEIAERKRVEAALRESEETYRALVETTGTGYVILDLEGRVLDANGEYVRLTGRSDVSQVLGHKVTEWTSSRDAARNAEAVRRCVERGFIRNLEIDYVSEAGTCIPIEVNATVLSRGNDTCIVSLCRDVSARRWAAAERRKLDTRMLQVQKLESLGVLAGGIAHDFNNLLVGILGNIDLAAADLPASSPVRQFLLEAEKTAQRAAELCRQMLAYSGKGRFVVQRLDLRELVEDVTQMLQVSISKKAILRYDFAADVPAVEADATQLRQVLMNLVINASEALGEHGGVISIATGVLVCDRAYLAGTHADDGIGEGTYACLTVSDTGCGMDEATKTRLFEPFFTTKFTGRGLGLSGVLGVVRGHKGAIEVQSEPGRGTIFRVLLPAANLPAERREAELAVDGWRGSGTILLADDEEVVRTVGRHMLERMGFRVLLANDGLEAVRMLQESRNLDDGKIICAILDMTMPTLSGEETFTELRRLQLDLPIILSSGFSEQDVTQKFSGKNLAGFIQKPYQTAALAATLRTVLSGTRN